MPAPAAGSGTRGDEQLQEMAPGLPRRHRRRARGSRKPAPRPSRPRAPRSPPRPREAAAAGGIRPEREGLGSGSSHRAPFTDARSSPDSAQTDAPGAAAAGAAGVKRPRKDQLTSHPSSTKATNFSGQLGVAHA